MMMSLKRWLARLLSKPVRCDTCPNWSFHGEKKEDLSLLYSFSSEGKAIGGTRDVIRLGTCRLSVPVVVCQSFVGYALPVRLDSDWCPHHPSYKNSLDTGLEYRPDVDRSLPENAGFNRTPTFEEACRIANVAESVQIRTITGD